MKKTLVTIVVVLLLTAAEEVYRLYASQHTAPAQDSTEVLTDSVNAAPLEIPAMLNSQPEQYIEHLAYTVSYNPQRRIPNWVAYRLDKDEVTDTYSRADKFLPDPMVKKDAVVTKDYSGSGYDRGHMAPAGDMRWSEQAMRESFYMTNICPQNHNNNAGDWKDLEELVRDLARRYGSIYICCGPIVTDENTTIGTARKIVVPQAFFKVLLRQKADGSWTSIGFVMPNQAGNRPLMTYMLSVDEAEEMTGLDFYPALPDDIENKTEADFVIADWTL
jgi:endonuclease G